MEIGQGPMENMVAQPAFWNRKKVFLTGHTGFKGSWLALWLQKLHADVFGFACPPHTTPNMFDIAAVDRQMISANGDVGEFTELSNAIKRHEPEIVFHLAAQALVRPSYQDPVETYRTNVMGTVNLLEAVRQISTVKVVVIITSDKCYHNREWVWGYRENDAMGGYDPYSSSKGCAELVTAAYRNSFFKTADARQRPVAAATARAGNVIGGGDWSMDRLIPDIIKAFIDQRPVKIRFPNAIRPWQHVLDPLQGYLDLAERLYVEGAAYASGWNFGPPDHESKSVAWIVEQMAGRWGDNTRWLIDEQRHPHEAAHLKLDCSKAHFGLGWRPRLPLNKALDWTIDWYRHYLNDADMQSVTLKQIDAYQEMEKDD